MHMADALLSPAVGLTMGAVTLGTLGYCAYKTGKDENIEKKMPIMAVSGALVFASQMVNFTIPGTGSSGHLGGGIILAALLGGEPAAIVMAIVLFIQALFFADGGLLALGCNVFNLGIIPCLLIYPLIFKPLIKKGLNYKTISIASVISVVIGLQLGAFGVVLETLASGVTELPFSSFVVLMQPIHLAIGVVEGLVTAAILCFTYKMRPEILENAAGVSSGQSGGMPLKKVVAILAAITLVVGGGLSLLASSFPDGLEWAMGKVSGKEELEAEGGIFERFANVQEKTSFMPDYNFASDGEEEGSATGTMVAGIVGSVITFAVAGGIGYLIYVTKKNKKSDIS